MSLVTGAWTLEDLKNERIGFKKNNLKVFSCFHCGGGSTMGYKLAGFDVIGGNEIDKDMMAIYRANHNPKHSYLMPIQEFKNIPNQDLPKELFELDVLDGSPPCSSFSMAGSREKKWGSAHAFREGQAVQHLDDLFFDYIDVAEKLKPKVVVAENVKGLIQGNARGYVKQIFTQFNKIGYSVQLFLLNASRMGVPQTRERTFFIANKMNKKIKLQFSEPAIPFVKSIEDLKNQVSKVVPDSLKGAGDWLYKNNEDEVVKWAKHNTGKEKFFTIKGTLPWKPVKTLISRCRHIFFNSDRFISDLECQRVQSFPDDYNFLDQDPGYVCGMSVPPLMMQRIAHQIHIQLLS